MTIKEGGFTYPLTLLIVSLLTLACLYSVEIYEVEKRYVLEQEKLLQLNNLVQMSIQDYLLHSEKEEGTMVIEYEIGDVELITNYHTSDIATIELRANIQNSYKRRAQFQVDVITNELIHFKDMT